MFQPAKSMLHGIRCLENMIGRARAVEIRKHAQMRISKSLHYSYHKGSWIFCYCCHHGSCHNCLSWGSRFPAETWPPPVSFHLIRMKCKFLHIWHDPCLSLWYLLCDISCNFRLSTFHSGCTDILSVAWKRKPIWSGTLFS